MSASTGKRNSRPASEGPVSDLVLAEPGQRLVARLIDTLIVGPPVAIVARSLLPESAYGVRPAETATAIGVAVLYLLYDTIQHALWGRTIGKRLTGIHVVPIVTGGAERGQDGGQRARGPRRPQESQRPQEHEPQGAQGAQGLQDDRRPPVRVGLPRALLRAALFALPIAARPVPVLSVVAGLFWVANAAWVLEGGDRQALHDRVARTAVVRTDPDPDPDPEPAPTPTTAA
jgi:uncharacterized RDD family membrane protein YckC